MQLKFNYNQFKTKNFKGVLSILAGSTISRIIAVVAGIFLANYYGPDSYGVYKVFLSYLLIIPVLASFRLENVMILQRGSKEIRNLFSGIVIIILIVSMILVTGISLLKFLNLINIELSYLLLVLIGVGSILSGWNISQNHMFTKYRLFKQISIAFVISTLVGVTFQGIFYFTGLTENGLIYGWLVGLTASFIYNVRVARSRFQKVDVSLFKQSVKENFKIIKYTYPSDSINAIANNIMPILVIAYFSQAEAGIYSMAFTILSAPLVLLSGAVSRVYFQKAVSLHQANDKSLESLTYRVIRPNVGIILLFVILMNTIGIYLLEMFLDDSWGPLRGFVLALSFWILARSAITPISPLILVLEKNEYSLIFNIYLLLVNFVGIYVGIQQGSFLTGVWVFSILSGLGYLCLLLMVLISLRKYAKS